MKLMRVRRKNKSTLLFLAENDVERQLVSELAGALSLEVNAEAVEVHDGEAFKDHGPSVAVDYATPRPAPPAPASVEEQPEHRPYEEPAPKRKKGGAE